MNKTFTILLFFFSCFITKTASAQGGKSPVEDVVWAFKNNKIQEFTRNFDTYVPVSINNNASNYSRNQAEIVVKDFFEKNPVRDFNVMDTGTPTNNNRSMIATFSSSSGSRYTLYLLLKMKDNGYLVREVRISKE